MKLNKQELEAVVKRFAQKPKLSVGICFLYINSVNYLNFKAEQRHNIASYLHNLLLECCKELGVYSGCEIYPIGNKVAYENYKLWSKTSKYGKNRWAVLNLMRKKLQEELDNA